MKKLFYLIFFFFILGAAYLFNFSSKTYAYSLCQGNSSWITCSSGSVTWRCNTSWVCTCTPAYAYASGGARCTKSTTYSNPVGYRGSDGIYHNCWFANIIPFSASCGTYTSPTLTATTSCSSTYTSQVKFSWTAVRDAISYRVSWNGQTAVSTTSTSYTATFPNNTSVSWWMMPCNDVGCFGKKSGPSITSKTCVVPTCTYTYSAWGACVGGTQTRTVISSSPAGCTGTPVLSQSCTVVNPNCNSGITCGSCNLSAGTCGSGSKSCKYTTLSGGGSCNQVAAPSQSCSVGCGTGEVCKNNQCVSAVPNCNSGITCGGCSPIAGSCGGGLKTCTYTTLSGGGTCKPISAPNGSCSIGCGPGETCTNNICVLPSCPNSLFSSFAPGGLPTGGLCMVNRIIGTLLSILLFVSVVFAMIFLIWGGIDWTTSGGDKQKIQKAKQKLTFAIIGLTVAFAAFAILHFVYSYFKIS